MLNQANRAAVIKKYGGKFQWSGAREENHSHPSPHKKVKGSPSPK
jgi:hypothetical protein